MTQIDFDQERLDAAVAERDTVKRDFVERGTRLLREIDNTKEDFKTLLEDAKKAGFKPKEIRQLATENFKNELGIKIDEYSKVTEELDRLFNV